MITSSDLWTTGVKPWREYFGEGRAAPPEDVVASDTLNPHEPYSDAARTERISRFDPCALRHTVGNGTLDLPFVQHILRSTGPIVTQADSSLWQFATQPGSFADIAQHEGDYYDWFNWVLSYPAASAVNAVRDKLYQDAGVPVPPNCSRTNKVNTTFGGGVADIIHHWSQGRVKTPCTPHEFKRDKVLRVDGQSVLDFLFEQAGGP
ncbi:hypothetical protein K438DRAFT_1971899 [Mycena galopus ATCC 62051]|nr:hypothetical protein K438DRAFT_1971899 [Mycena galopus ATCC 62051]